MLPIEMVVTSSKSEVVFDICFDENGRNVQVRNPVFSSYPPNMQPHFLCKIPTPQASSLPGVSLPTRLLNKGYEIPSNNILVVIYIDYENQGYFNRAITIVTVDLPYTLPLFTTTKQEIRIQGPAINHLHFA